MGEATPEESASEVLDVVPMVMRDIRKELRKQGANELSVPQFRTLMFLDRTKQASLSDVAEHVGLTLPSMSVLIDGLVDRGLAKRQSDSTDRRRITLALTNQGRTRIDRARAAAHKHLTDLFMGIPSRDRSTIARAMRILKSIMIKEAG